MKTGERTKGTTQVGDLLREWNAMPTDLKAFKAAQGLSGKLSAGLGMAQSAATGATGILDTALAASGVADTSAYEGQLADVASQANGSFYDWDTLQAAEGAMRAAETPSYSDVRGMSAGEKAAHVGSGLVQGFQAGNKMAGPIGAAVGGLIGAAGSLAGVLVGDHKAEVQKEWLDNQAQAADDAARLNLQAGADELRDRQARLAAVNVAAYGGRVSRPSFTEAARMSRMDVKRFADRVLAADRRNERLKRTARLAGAAVGRTYSDGGEKMEGMSWPVEGMGRYGTHGAFLSPGVTFVGAGGTHESNPNGGVRVGADAQGVPNLVEQGEAIYGDYVFSRRLKAGRAELERHNLPARYAGMAFSDIAAKLSEEAADRPDDAISLRGMGAMLDRLTECQEAHKADVDARRAKRAVEAMPPAQVAAMASLARQAQMQQQAAQQPAQPPAGGGVPPMAHGGRLAHAYAPGGPLETDGDAKTIYDAAAGNYQTGYTYDPSLSPGLNRLYYNRAKKEQERLQAAYDQKQAYADALAAREQFAKDWAEHEKAGDNEWLIEHAHDKNVQDRITDRLADREVYGTRRMTWKPEGYGDVLAPAVTIDGAAASTGAAASAGAGGAGAQPAGAATSAGAGGGNYTGWYADGQDERSTWANTTANTTYEWLKSALAAAEGLDPEARREEQDAIIAQFNDMQRQYARTSGMKGDHGAVAAYQTLFNGMGLNPEGGFDGYVEYSPGAGSGDREGDGWKADGWWGDATQARHGGSTSVTDADYARRMNDLLSQYGIRYSYNSKDGVTDADGNYMYMLSRTGEQLPVPEVGDRLGVPEAGGSLKGSGQAAQLQPAGPAGPDVDGGGTPDAAGGANPAGGDGRLPTWMREGAAFAQAAAAIPGLFARPDEVRTPRLAPAVPGAQLNLRDRRYAPVDPNMAMAAVRSAGAANARALANSGLGPSAGAALLANANGTAGRLGQALYQGRLADAQQYDAVTAANNANAQARAANAMQNATAYAEAVNAARRYNSAASMNDQLRNNQYETDHWSGVSANLTSALNNAAAIGTQNWNMNMANTNGAFKYGVGADGGLGYKKARGGRLTFAEAMDALTGR